MHWKAATNVWLASLLFLSGAIISTSFAQSGQLSRQQLELLNQLPPSQREAALEQLRQMNTEFQSAEQKPDPATDDDDSASSDLTPEILQLIADQPPRLAAMDTVVIDVSGEIEDVMLALAERLRANNPYVLDSMGRISIPTVGQIQLAGLTEAQAIARLELDPALQGLTLHLSLLPLSPVGLDTLQPYGYGLFADDRKRKSSDLSFPVPSNYTIGPGDVIRVQTFGNQNNAYEVTVERDGTISFPELGPMTVAGMSFGQLREFIAQQVSEKLIGTQASVSLGDLRTVQVFLVGDVNQPGSYSVGALATMTTVLAEGGGVSEQGSLRAIELKRNGHAVGKLDVYALLLRGDSSGDRRVQAGDVVFVPPVGNRVTIAGEVKRPAIYEYKGAANVEDVIGLAGGLASGAHGAGVKIRRLDPENGYVTLDADLSSDAGRRLKIRDGDTLIVPGTIERVAQSVELLGNVHRPGSFEWRAGLRLSDIIPNSLHLKPNTDTQYVLIRREETPNGAPSFLSANVDAAWAMKGSAVDTALQPRDRVHVFDLASGRLQYVQPLMDELMMHATAETPFQAVSIGGGVNARGVFPLEAGMRVADLVRAGGGLAQSAYTREAELTRYEVEGDVRTASVVTIDLGAALDGDARFNVLLQPFDYLNVRETPQWQDAEYVELIGEFAFPGIYPIRRGEKLSSVVARAGGLTDLAYAPGSVFTREDLRIRERAQLDELAQRVERDLTSLSLADAAQSEAISTGQGLLRQLRETEPTGRLVIDLDDIVAGSASDDIVLRDGDVLRIPQIPQSVTVLGEVQYGSSHLFDSSLDRSDYIFRSGGMTSKADKRRIYVVRANGEVVVGNRSRFFSRTSGVPIEPGDTIVVPLDTDRIKPLALWTGVTQVVYNLAIAVAAVNSF
ncbi:MAG: SLBB domain-containing protein [Gammaproteobacteria bacterium]|nr:SLBB domain-containing protein [Gammaproteobacteria bacterium]